MGDEIWVVRDIDPEFDHEPEESEGYEGSCSCSDSDEPTKSADLDLAPDGEAQVPVEETTVVDLDAAEKTAEEMAKEISPELREAFSAVMKALDESVTAIETLKAERDELKTQLAAAKADFEVAAEIVDSLSRLPLARKTSARAQINSFNQKFSGIYSDSWLKLIDDRNKETKDEPLP